MNGQKSRPEPKFEKIKHSIMIIKRIFDDSNLNIITRIPPDYFDKFDTKKMESLFGEIVVSLKDVGLLKISKEFEITMGCFRRLKHDLSLIDNNTKTSLYRITAAARNFKGELNNKNYVNLLKSKEKQLLSHISKRNVKQSSKKSITSLTKLVDKGFCIKCKAKRLMKHESHVTMKNGRHATKGTCSVCGTKMFKIGGGPSKAVKKSKTKPKSKSKAKPKSKSQTKSRGSVKKAKSQVRKSKISEDEKWITRRSPPLNYYRQFRSQGRNEFKPEHEDISMHLPPEIGKKDSRLGEEFFKDNQLEGPTTRRSPKPRSGETVHFERYPEATFPVSVELGRIEELKVKIVAVRPNITAPTLTLTWNKVSQNIVVQVTLSIDTHFESIENRHEGVINVPTTQDDSVSITFKLKAIMKGKSEIRLQFWQEGSYLGQMSILSTVHSSSNNPAKVVSSKGTMPFRGENYQPSARLASPDLTISVEKLSGSEQYSIGFIKGRECVKYYRKLETAITSEDYINSILSDLNQPTIMPQQIDATMINAGKDLYKAIFEEGSDLRKAYVKIVKQGIKSIVIHSNEPYIPWEIVRQHGDGLEEGFLCELYSITRWRPPHGWKPRSEVIKKADIVFPTTDLRTAADEKNLVEGLLKQYGITPNIISTVPIIFHKLKSGDFDMMHFASHGNFDNSSGVSIPLNGGVISPTTVTWGKLNQPFVFMNACSTGRQTLKYSRINGWTTRFMDNGASVFIGTLWPVDETRAKDFAESFYNNLKEGMAVGEAVKRARMLSKREHDISHLAYVLYSQPFLVLKFEN